MSVTFFVHNSGSDVELQVSNYNAEYILQCCEKAFDTAGTITGEQALTGHKKTYADAMAIALGEEPRKSQLHERGLNLTQLVRYSADLRALAAVSQQTGKPITFS